MGNATSPAQSAALGLLVGGALLCWCVALMRGEVHVKRVPYGWLLSAFLLLVLASVVTALDRTVAVFGNQYAEQGLLAMAAYAAVFLLATQIVDGRRDFLRILQFVALSGAVVALLGVLQSLGLPYFPLAQASYLTERGTSSLGNPDTLGTFLIIPLLLSLGLSLSTPSPRRWLWRTCAAVTAASLLLTQTRGAWLGAVVALVIFGVVIYRSPKQGRGMSATWVGAGLLLLVGVGAAVYKAATGAQPLLSRLTQTGADGGRLFVWSEVLKIVGKYPVLGAGPDNIVYAWYRVSNSAQVHTMGIDGVINDAHNYWLGTAVSSGVLAAVLLVAFVAAVLAGSRSAVTERRAVPVSPDRAGFAALWAGVVGLAVALVFSPILTPIGLVLWLSLGLLALPKARPPKESAFPGRMGCVVVAVSAIVGLSLVGWGGATGLSSTIEYVRDGSGRDPVEAARTASRMAPWRQPALLLEAQALRNNGASAEEILPVLDRLIALAPHDYYYYLAKAQLLDAQPSQVIATADAGLQAYPAGLRLIMLRALAQAALGDFAPAERDSAAVWSLARDVVPAYREPSAGIAYAQILAAQGKKAQAKTIVDELQAAFPQNADVKKLQSVITTGSP
jgi:O-antigen ligase